MSVCNCPVINPERQREMSRNFLQQVEPEWCLLSITDMARAGNSAEDIAEVIPFRGGPCARSMRCCGMCTRQCYHRCIQDCLHRVYMWRKMVETTPATEREKLPLNLRLIVTQKFETSEDLSWVVGEILSRNTNTQLKEYMNNALLRPEQNPYKMDYSPQVDIDPSTGKRKCNPYTGELCILSWPRTGLCPFCLPGVTIDGRVARRALRDSSSGGPGT